MELCEFLRLLDLHGPDLGRWPDDAPASAACLMIDSANARRALAEARTLDGLLRASAPAIDDAAVIRVLRGVAAAARRPPVALHVALRVWGLAPLWPRLGFLA